MGNGREPGDENGDEVDGKVEEEEDEGGKTRAEVDGAAPSVLHREGAVARKNLSLSKWSRSSRSWCVNGRLKPP